MSENNPYFAPAGEAALKPEALPDSGFVIDPIHAGTPARRGLAMLIDLGLNLGLAVVASALAGIHMLRQSKTMEEFGAAADAMSDAGGILAYLLYRAVSEWIGGATVGKLVLGLRVRRAGDFGPCGPFAAFVRSVLFLVDSFLLFLPGLMAMERSPMKARIGDQVARTVVVRTEGIPEHARLSPLRTVAGVAGGCCVPVLLIFWLIVR